MHEQIKSQIKEAMLAKDSLKLGVLRGLLAAFTNELVATKRTPQEILSDEEVIAVIRRATKQRKDSIEQFEKGGRPELAEDEKKELSILETFLPQMMSREEIKKVVEAKKAEMGEVDKSKLGIFMGSVMKELKGKADGADVKAVIDESFS
jgi:uncharacterized protein